MLKGYEIIEGAREIIKGWGSIAGGWGVTALIAIFLLVGPGSGNVRAEASYPVQTHRVCFTPEAVKEIFSQPTMKELDAVFARHEVVGTCLYFPISMDADAVEILGPVTGFFGTSNIFKLWPEGSRKGAPGYWAAPEKLIRKIRTALRGV